MDDHHDDRTTDAAADFGRTGTGSTGAVGEAAQDGPGLGVARPDDFGVRRGQEQHRSGGRVWGVERNGWQMAVAVCGAETGRAVGRAPQRPARSVTDDDVERVITLPLETTHQDATHWSTRSMAQRCGLRHNTVGRIWRAFGLRPHRTETLPTRRR